MHLKTERGAALGTASIHRNAVPPVPMSPRCGIRLCGGRGQRDSAPLSPPPCQCQRGRTERGSAASAASLEMRHGSSRGSSRSRRAQRHSGTVGIVSMCGLACVRARVCHPPAASVTVNIRSSTAIAAASLECALVTHTYSWTDIPQCTSSHMPHPCLSRASCFFEQQVSSRNTKIPCRQRFILSESESRESTGKCEKCREESSRRGAGGAAMRKRHHAKKSRVNLPRVRVRVFITDLTGQEK